MSQVSGVWRGILWGTCWCLALTITQSMYGLFVYVCLFAIVCMYSDLLGVGGGRGAPWD